MSRNYLDLHMPIDPEGSVAATAPLAWCVTRELTEHLKESEFLAPHLLVIVRAKKTDGVGSVRYDEWFDRRAFVVPLQNALVYTSFNTDGEHEIHAFIVDIRSKDDARYVRKFTNSVQSRGEAGLQSIVDEDGELRIPDHTDFMDRNLPQVIAPLLRRQGESITVHVPAEMFAPPPAEWRQKTVSKFFKKNKAVDQCHFRKRFWFISLPLAAAVVPIFYVYKALLIVLGYAIGTRRLAVKHAFTHPLSQPSDLWKSSSPYFSPLEDRDGNNRFSVWTFLNLPVIIALTLTVRGVQLWGVGQFLGVVLLIVASAGVAAGVMMLLQSDRYRTFKNGRERRERDEYRRKTLASLEDMLCETNLPANSVRELPKSKQTVSLRFYDFKTKVCKPFAR